MDDFRAAAAVVRHVAQCRHVHAIGKCRRREAAAARSSVAADWRRMASTAECRCRRARPAGVEFESACAAEATRARAERLRRRPRRCRRRTRGLRSRRICSLRSRTSVRLDVSLPSEITTSACFRFCPCCASGIARATRRTSPSRRSAAAGRAARAAHGDRASIPARAPGNY